MSIPSPNAADELLLSIEDPEQNFGESEDLMGVTDCPEGCKVEADGICPHNYESAGITAGMI